jgi:DNA-binding NarL/FixJ family response regulator
MPRDILIVEDDPIVLASYGAHIELNLRIKPFLARSPEEALNIAEIYPLKVLVTDYDLSSVSNINGIDLVKKMRTQLGLTIPYIMVTGYSDKVTGKEATCAGLYLVIDKNETENELIPTIRQALAIFEENSRKKTLWEFNQVIETRKKYLFSKHKVDLILLRVSSVTENVVFDQTWVTDYTAERGICRINEREIEYEATSSIEYGANGEIINEFNFNSDRIINLISSIVETKLTSSFKEGLQKTIRHKAKYSIEIKDLINEPADQGFKLLSRQYQSAPVYIRINCVFQIDCSFCGIPRFLDLSVVMPTNKIALRQVEHYNTGPSKTIYTGFITSSIY